MRNDQDRKSRISGVFTVRIVEFVVLMGSESIFRLRSELQVLNLRR